MEYSFEVVIIYNFKTFFYIIIVDIHRYCDATKDLLDSLNCKYKVIELDEMGKLIKTKEIIK